ncbi:MAG: TRAP transporter small permease [Leptothrix sp. (in: b-proteobacteria)]
MTTSSAAAARAAADPAGEPGHIRLVGRLVGAANAVGLAAAALGVLAALALITYAVVLRYAFNQAPAWVDECVGYLLVGVVMLAASTTMRQGGHISVDILTGSLGPRGRRLADGWSSLAMAAVALILVVNGWETAQSSKMLGLTTNGALELPIYLLQLLLPLGGVLMLLVSLEDLLRRVAGLPPLAQAGHGPHGQRPAAAEDKEPA